MRRLRPNEGQPRLGAHPGKIATLREEPVPWVDGVTAGRRRRRDHGPGIQIGRRALAWQRPAFVSDAKVQAAGVVFRIHGDGGQAHVGRGAGDADGDLAPVGDQQLCHAHGVFVRRA
jgi:hypothetical protein